VYMESAVRAMRALVLLARDRTGSALADMDLTVAHARKILEPQTLLPSLGYGAHVYAELGDDEQAGSLLDELLATMERPDVWLFPAIFALDRLHRLDDLMLEPATGSISRWVDAGRLYAEGRRMEAADLLEEIGSLPDAAFARLRAAEVLSGKGRSEEARRAFDQALAFYRRVGATRFVRRAEHALAASA
jgi:tetratricopeptide (TPR) repeat protein